MKKENPIRALLGIKQEDMAMLLRVSRSQWSMFELGKRDLPVEAKYLLVAMLKHLQEPVVVSKSLPHEAEQLAKKQAQLERLLKENEYQQLRIAKKLAAGKKKYAANLKRLQLVHFLTTHNHAKQRPNTELLQTIAKRSTNELDDMGLATLFKHELKQELLQLEK